MTEAEWLTCDDPEPLLDYLCHRASKRKLRLFACACCRDVLQTIPNECCESALRIAEQYADGWATDDELKSAEASLCQVRPHNSADWLCCSFACRLEQPAIRLAQGSSVYAADALAIASNEETRRVHMRWTPTWSQTRTRQSGLLRDIFGNPFRPVTLNPAWRTANVVGIAQSIYEERAFDRMPILADALEDAGCTQAELQKHCREPGEHVRGCWLVDLVLAKE